MKVFEPQAKHDLVVGRETHVAKLSSETFLVVEHQVCRHLRRDFKTLLFTKTLNLIGFLAAAWQLKVSAPSTDFLKD